MQYSLPQTQIIQRELPVWPHADIICQVQLDQRCYLLTEAAGKFFYFAQLQLERHPEETTDTQIPDHQL